MAADALLSCLLTCGLLFEFDMISLVLSMFWAHNFLGEQVICFRSPGFAGSTFMSKICTDSLDGTCRIVHNETMAEVANNRGSPIMKCRHPFFIFIQWYTKN